MSKQFLYKWNKSRTFDEICEDDFKNQRIYDTTYIISSDMNLIQKLEVFTRRCNFDNRYLFTRNFILFLINKFHKFGICTFDIHKRCMVCNKALTKQ